MTERGETAQQGGPGAPPSALRAAVLRIGAGLDLDTVLSEVVDAARTLTGADCGATATVDANGRPGDFVTFGLTEEEHRALEGWPDGPSLFAHLDDLGRAEVVRAEEAELSVPGGGACAPSSTPPRSAPRTARWSGSAWRSTAMPRPAHFGTPPRFE